MKKTILFFTTLVSYVSIFLMISVTYANPNTTDKKSDYYTKINQSSLITTPKYTNLKSTNIKYYEQFPNVIDLESISNVKPDLVLSYKYAHVYCYLYNVDNITQDNAEQFVYFLEDSGFRYFEFEDSDSVYFEDGKTFVYIEQDEQFFAVVLGNLEAIKILEDDFYDTTNIEDYEVIEENFAKNSIGNSSTEQPIKVTINETQVKFDQPPENINGRVMVPIRYVVERLGCEVVWDDATQTVYINSPNIPLDKKAVKTDNINVYVNNELIIFTDQQPVNINGRVLIPIRYVVERLGCTVQWDDENKVVIIKKEFNAV